MTSATPTTCAKCFDAPAMEHADFCAECSIRLAFDNCDPAEAIAIAADADVDLARVLEIQRECERAKIKHDASAALVRALRSAVAANSVDAGVLESTGCLA